MNDVAEVEQKPKPKFVERLKNLVVGKPDFSVGFEYSVKREGLNERGVLDEDRSYTSHDLEQRINFFRRLKHVMTHINQAETFKIRYFDKIGDGIAMDLDGDFVSLEATNQKDLERLMGYVFENVGIPTKMWAGYKFIKPLQEQYGIRLDNDRIYRTRRTAN